MNPFDLGPHAGFIIASYLITFGVMAVMILWVFLDRAKQKAALKELEGQGITRASQRPSTRTPPSKP
ncbi:heme exporter protein CcmD [Roseibium sp. RKSG952]|uniref:heme exporter protein CcmD n=1 Tax=Roseibium sp. RKSG952 TaxID=2529384 RepID=UPI0012BD411A|nr:heme exporter protein CcmD [Roseibium sp. RKSG952]MTH98227.1 heme exporter protein CcmD [Roseibium sp. RKSG952]